MNGENVTKLYQTTQRYGFADLGDESQFRSKIVDEGNRKKLYDALSAEGVQDLGTIEEFNDKLGFSTPAQSNISGGASDSTAGSQRFDTLGGENLSSFGITPETYPFKGNTFADAAKMAGEKFAADPERLKHSRKEGFWNTYLGDMIEEVGAGAAGMQKNALGLLSKAADAVSADGVGGVVSRTVAGPFLSLVLGASKNKLKNGADAMKDIEQKLDERADRYDGESFRDLYNKGDYYGMTGQIFLEASRSLPQSLAAAFTGGAGLVGIGLTAANEKYDELNANTNLNEVQKISSAVLSGTFEAASELLGSVPIGKWIKSVYKSAGKDVAKSQIQNGISSWMQKQFKTHGVLLAPFAEGVEEVSSQIATNAVDKALGVSPDIDILDGAFESFVYGSAGGAQFSAAAVPGILHNANERRKVKNKYKEALESVHSAFPEEAESVLPEMNRIVDYGSSEELNMFFNMLSRNDSGISEEQHDLLMKYTFARRRYSALQKGEADEVAQEQQRAAELVQENLNPDMNAIVYAKIGEQESPVQIVKGNIVKFEDGGINWEESSQEIVYIDENGETKIAPIRQVEDLTDVIPSDQAIQQAQTEVIEPIISRQTDDEIREYAPGEMATVQINGTMRLGQVNPSEDGNYIFTDNETKQEIPVRPSQIVNEDNLLGINQGDEVVYRDIKGEQRTGILEDAVNFRNQGEVIIDNERIPVANVLSLADQQAESSKLSQELQENAGVTSGRDSIVSTDETNTDEASESTGEQFMQNESVTAPLSEQIPIDEKGVMQFEQAPKEATIAALSEVYDESAELNDAIDATIANLQKEVEKARAPKPTGDIAKDYANKQASKDRIQELNRKIDYWNGVKTSIDRKSVV